MTSFALKIIAFISMATHHAEMTNLISQSRLMEWFQLDMLESARLLTWISVIDRLAFPIFTFLIAEGCRHTRSKSKYLLRLLLFGVISEFPFDMLSAWMFPNSPLACFSPFDHLNVFFTHSVGVLGIMMYDWMQQRGIKPVGCILALALLALPAELLQVDYRFSGVLLIWAAYFPKTRTKQILWMIVVLAFLYLLHNYGYSFPINPAQWQDFFASCAALLFIAFYNGKQGHKCKWGFYIAYPLHISLFAAIGFLVN